MLEARQIRLTPAQLSVAFAIFAVIIGAAVGLLVLSVGNPVKILAGVFAICVVLGAFVKIELGLLALVFLTYTNSYDVASRLDLPPIAPLLIAFLLATIVFHAVFRSQTPSGWLRPAILMYTFAICGIISYAYASDLNRLSEAFFAFLTATTLAAIVLMLLQNLKFLRQVIWMMILAGCFMASISIYQYFTDSWGHNFAGFGRAEISQITSTVTVFRISGPIGDANFYAQILIVLLPLALGRAWHEKSKLLRLIALTAAAMIALTVVLTFSRGAFLALLFTLILSAIWLRPKWKHLLIAGVLSLPLLTLVPDAYFERISTIKELLPGHSDGNLSDQAFRGRASEWKAAWLMFTDHPILGVGLGNYPVHYQQYSRDIGLDPRLSQRSAHSLYLQIAAETGVVGIAILGFILWKALKGLWRVRKRFLEASMQDAANLTGAFLIGFLGYLFAGLFLHAAYPNFLWMLIGIALALPIVAENEMAVETERVPSL